MQWNDIEPNKRLPRHRPILCYCPEWNESGYQVSFWDGKEFFYPSQPNDDFHKHVTRWALFIEAD